MGGPTGMDWNAKVGSQETPGVTGKFGLGIQNEAEQRIEFCQENALVIANTLFQHLPSDLGFSYLRHGVSLHSCSSKGAAAPYPGRGVSPHCRPS